MFGVLGWIGGIVLILIGAAMVFFLPASKTYQSSEFNMMAIVIGFVLIILGGILIFV